MQYLILIKTFIAAIKTVEQLMPDSKGKEKFDAALAIVSEIVSVADAQIPALQAVATLVVNGLRAAGVFKAKAAA